MIATRQRRDIPAFLARHRATFLVVLVAVLSSSGTAAAVSYLVLGGTNTAASTTTLKSAVNGAVLQLTNTNATNGIGAHGLSITVPAGRAPMIVNSGIKVTNLNADKLDGIDASAFARGAHVTLSANRIVLGNGDPLRNLLSLPGLGLLRGSCGRDGPNADIYWTNTSAVFIDMWSNNSSDGHLRAHVISPGNDTFYAVASWVPGSNGMVGFQTGDTLALGYGNDPGARRAATVTLSVYRSDVSAPCGFQATATLWSTP